MIKGLTIYNNCKNHSYKYHKPDITTINHGYSQSQMLHVWNIYQHLPEQNHPNVGKYISTMEHLGMIFPQTEPIIYGMLKHLSNVRGFPGWPERHVVEFWHPPTACVPVNTLCLLVYKNHEYYSYKMLEDVIHHRNIQL